MGKTTNPAKVKRAAAHPDRPGEACKAAPGAYRPEVNVRGCEGKGDCLEVCPYDVFEIGRVPDAVYASMPLHIKLKMRVHGRRTAFTPRADACLACGLCVVACPEGAIRLVAANKASN